jgi:glutamate--cysteine ligase
VLRDAVVEPHALGRTVGLEVEAFPMTREGVRLHVSETATRIGCDPVPGEVPRTAWGDAAVSFEPGGQIEVSTPPKSSISGAVDAQLRAWDGIGDLVAGRLVFAGLDLWNEVDRVPLQLAAPRYPAMDRHLASKSRWGRVMMRHTASVQINLDGGGDLFGHRVRVAQALAPFVTASFATSPVPGAHSGRARVWQRLDRTRTGFLDLTDGVAGGMWSKANGADVLVVRRPDGWFAGSGGFTYNDWAGHGHPDWGRPGADDLRYHLTTLFPEVRPRHGTLEIRSPDSVPPRLLPALVVLVAAGVYHPPASGEILEMTKGLSLPHLWGQAARDGLHHKTLAGTASRVWSVTLEAARTMSDGIDARHLDLAGAFVERFVKRSISPADELRGALARGHAAGLDWATADGSTNGAP